MKLDLIAACTVVFVIITGASGDKSHKGTKTAQSQPKRYSESNIVTTQNIAAKQAATQVKAILAQKAINAATTANAALVGKEVLVQELVKRVREAAMCLCEQDNHLQQAKSCAEVSYNNVLKQQQEIEQLSHAVSSARLALASAQKDAKVAAERYESLATIIEAAKEKYSYLLVELKSAKTDLDATRAAARRAEAAAEAAKANINTPELNLSQTDECDPNDVNTIDIKVNCPTSCRSVNGNLEKSKKSQE